MYIYMCVCTYIYIICACIHSSTYLVCVMCGIQFVLCAVFSVCVMCGLPSVLSAVFSLCYMQLCFAPSMPRFAR